MSKRASPAKTVLFYGDSDLDDHPYEIEIGDEVEFLGDGQFGPATHLGEIKTIQPKKKTAKVTYLDETDWTVNGDPRRKTAIVATTALTLIRRVM